MFRIYTYPRGFYRGYTAYIVLRLPCCCSGHNIIPTTHRQNEPFIAALLGCCFLSQANTTASSSPNRRPRSQRSRLLSFRASIPLPPFSRPSRTHARPLSALRYIALRCEYVPRRCTRRAALHLRSELHSLRVACHENFVGVPLAAANYRRDVFSRTIVAAGERKIGEIRSHS